MLRGQSVNKIITEARNSIKRQSRYLSAGALCHSAVSQSTRSVARASKTRTRSTVNTSCALEPCIFFSPPGFLSVELSAAEAIALPDEIFSRLAFSLCLSFSHFYPRGNGCKKIFPENGGREQRLCFLRMRSYFLKKKGKGKQQRDYVEYTTVSYRESLTGNCHWNCMRFATGEKGKSAE